MYIGIDIGGTKCAVIRGGADGGRLAQLCHCAIRVPARETYQVQELHLPVYHALCAAVEAELFGEG